MRVAVERDVGWAEADLRELLLGGAHRLAGAGAAVVGEHLRDLRADRLYGIERGHRLLEDHAYAVTADGAHVALGLGGEVLAIEQDAAGHAGSVR